MTDIAAFLIPQIFLEIVLRHAYPYPIRATLRSVMDRYDAPLVELPPLTHLWVGFGQLVEWVADYPRSPRPLKLPSVVWVKALVLALADAESSMLFAARDCILDFHPDVSTAPRHILIDFARAHDERTLSRS